MFLKLNLLPPEEKKKIKLLQFSNLLVSFGFWLLFLMIIFSLLMVSVFVFLHIISNAQSGLMEQREKNEKTQALFEVEEKISETNKSINQIYKKQEEMIVWTPILEKTSEIIPEGVYLNAFSYNKSSERVNISGYAETREALLEYEKNLKESEYFKEVESPLSNIIKKEDIEFSFQITPIKAKSEKE
jgi:Tfp pilus assembly protein PilN